jgi:HME family heavy-metal exporter
MFQAIVTASLKNRLFIVAAALFLLAWGLASVQRLPVDVLPDLNKPTVTIMTEAGGMAPEEVEQLVTFPIESAMNGLPGVARVRSVSAHGLAIVFVEFDWGSDLYRNRQQVAERLGVLGTQLPDGVQAQLGPITSIMGEVMLIALTTRDPAVTPMQLRELAEWVVRPQLLTLPGVAQVIPIGGELRQFQIQPDVARMQQLGITLAQIEAAAQGFSANYPGGFVEQHGAEYVIRNLGRTTRQQDLEKLVVGYAGKHPILLQQVAEIRIAAQLKRGDASYNAAPAVILSVQKQPTADTLILTRAIEATLAELARTLPKGVAAEIAFRQADFISAALDNLAVALRDAALIIAVVLFLFLLDLRTTVIALAAIPVSVLITALVFRHFGLSVNSMTLGGIAIAVGELVDDAVVGAENVLRRLRQNRASASPRPALAVIGNATTEVRSGIYYATLIIVLVFVPLFALTGVEGRLFAPLGIAYIVSITASMLVSMTLTPVLCYYLLGNRGDARGDSALLTWLKGLDRRLLDWSFKHHRPLFAGALLLVLLATLTVPWLPRAFLPEFNEGTLTVNVILQPGTSLSESNRVGQLAEKLLLGIPEVAHVGRRTGRAELDEHAEGVHYSELDVVLKPDTAHDRDTLLQQIRTRLAVLPAALNIGQPISHRLDHLLSGVRADISLKIYGDDLDGLQRIATALRERLARIQGLADLQIERQVRVPQLQIRVAYDRARQFGVTPAAVNTALETLSNGKIVSYVIEDNRRYPVVIRLPESARSAESLAGLLIETPSGHVPLSQVADISHSDGPNQISHDNGRRRLVISANQAGADNTALLAAIRHEIAATRLPEGYFIELEGQFKAQQEAARLIAGLALLSLILIVIVLYNRYRSFTLTLIILANIPLALVGSVVALALSGNALSVASLVGFITLTGIAVRNGILKISHYINLVAHEGEQFGAGMIVRGSLERLAPVLMTASVAALALLPLMLAGQAPGKEILHPVAVVIFGGLISSTLLDTLLTPVMYQRFGARATERLIAERRADTDY